MPSTIPLILRSVEAQPRRVSKDAGCNAAERFTRPFAGTTIYVGFWGQRGRAGPLPAAGHHARLARTAKEGGADGAQDLRHPALARLSHRVDGEGAGTRLRERAD